MSSWKNNADDVTELAISLQDRVLRRLSRRERGLTDSAFSLPVPSIFGATSEQQDPPIRRIFQRRPHRAFGVSAQRTSACFWTKATQSHQLQERNPPTRYHALCARAASVIPLRDGSQILTCLEQSPRTRSETQDPCRTRRRIPFEARISYKEGPSSLQGARPGSSFGSGKSFDPLLFSAQAIISLEPCVKRPIALSIWRKTTALQHETKRNQHRNDKRVTSTVSLVICHFSGTGTKLSPRRRTTRTVGSLSLRAVSLSKMHGFWLKTPKTTTRGPHTTSITIRTVAIHRSFAAPTWNLGLLGLLTNHLQMGRN